ncbi:MAG: undecaprenyl-phosphate glucose phosphotransferase [Sphingomonadales bacterium]
MGKLEKEGRQSSKGAKAEPLKALSLNLDFGGILAAGVLAFLVRFGPEVPGANYLVLLALGTGLSILFLNLFHLYDRAVFSNPLSRQFRLWGVWSGVFVALVLIGFLTKTSEDFSRIWVVTWYVFGLGGLFFSNASIRIVHIRLKRAGYLTQKIAVVGVSDIAGRLLEHLSSRKAGAPQLVGVYDDRNKSFSKSEPKKPLKVIAGGLDHLEEEIRAHRVNEVILAIPWDQPARIQKIVSRLSHTPVAIHLSPGPVAFDYLYRAPVTFHGLNLLNLALRPLSHLEWLIKGLEDRLLGALLLLAAAPIMVLVALAIKLDSPGPVVFKQKRQGFNNKEFPVFKFRSMVDGRKEAKGVPQAKKDDPRVTRVGGFLRRTSLDELPQLVNVVCGKMSLVGPRPHALAHNDIFARKVADYFARSKIKPGITGWAQVHGYRGEIKTDEDIKKRVQYDLYYLEHWSLWLDLKILALTVAVVLFQKKAY